MSTLTFEYQAVDKLGAAKRGSLAAGNEAEAFRLLTAQGLIPLAVSPARALLARGTRFKTRDLSHFTAQLAVLVSARVPIADGLLSIAQQEPNKRLAAVIRSLAAQVEAGTPLADAMSGHSEAFGSVYIETIRAAEKSGNLIKVLEHVAEMLERSEETGQQVKSALMYPLCVVGVLALAVVFLVGFVVPKFGVMFASRGVELPLMTQVLMAAGLSVQTFWYAYLGGVAGVVIAIRQMWRTPRGRAMLDRLLHRIPVIREVLKGLAIGRFTRVLGVSLGSGLGLIEALELAGRATGRPMLIEDVERMSQQVRVGGRLSEVLASCAYLTPFSKRMLSAGEDSGELPRMCALIARHHDRETTFLTKNLATAIEPVLIVLIAGAVLVVALAIFLPMWSMGNLIK